MLLILVSALLLAPPQEISFKAHGALKEKITLAQLGTPRHIKVFEPHENQVITYLGFPARDVFDKIYGKQWSQADSFVFTCSDGYAPVIPTAKFNQYDAYLVFARAGRVPFQMHDKAMHKTIDLAPYFLVWDNLQKPEINTDGAIGWPYQLTSIDLVTFTDRFPGVAPPSQSSAHIKAGFVAFRSYCLPCHTINGEGGAKGIELNYPVNVTEYFDTAWLKRWISKPTDIRFNSSMPPLSASVSNRDKVIDDIVSYLKTMAHHKQKPRN